MSPEEVEKLLGAEPGKPVDKASGWAGCSSWGNCGKK